MTAMRKSSLFLRQNWSTKSRKSEKDQRIYFMSPLLFTRFPLPYPIGADFWKDYLENSRLFLSNLSPGVKERLVIRPHREDGGMDFKERFRDIIPDVRIETWAKAV